MSYFLLLITQTEIEIQTQTERISTACQRNLDCSISLYLNGHYIFKITFILITRAIMGILGLSAVWIFGVKMIKPVETNHSCQKPPKDSRAH